MDIINTPDVDGIAAARDYTSHLLFSAAKTFLWGGNGAISANKRPVLAECDNRYEFARLRAIATPLQPLVRLCTLIPIAVLRV